MDIGVDFGTCFSSVTIMNGDIPNGSYLRDTTGQGIPSLFMHSSENGEDIFGEGCLSGYAVRHRTDVVRYMKRAVREDPSNLDMKITSGGCDYTMRRVIELYLTYLLDETRKAAERCGEIPNTEIETVTITAPVGIKKGHMMATDYNRFLHETVMDITGLPGDKVKVLQEPVAAAISYLYNDIRNHYDGIQRVMVFDLGGGTLDVSIVEHNPDTGKYYILSKEGDLRLGGNDWDRVLQKIVLGDMGIEWSDTEDRWPGTPEEKAEFERKITKFKIELTNEEEASITFRMNGSGRHTVTSRVAFEEMSKELLDRAMDIVDKAMERCDSPIDKAVLVGGSSNMPMIEKTLSEHTGIPADSIMVYEPSKAISKGAAIFSRIDRSVVDICNQTYGFLTMFNGSKESIYNMIYKGDGFDGHSIVKVTDDCFTANDKDQKSVVFKIYESECMRGEGFYEDWFDCGNGEDYNGLYITVPIPEQYWGDAKKFGIWIKLSLDDNGIMEFTATDRDDNVLDFATNRFGGSE